MEETKQSSQPVPQAQELKAGEGSGNAEAKSSVVADTSTSAPAQEQDGRLEFINKATGRTYKTLDDAEKGLKETVGYVGTLGQKASHFDKLVNKIVKEENVSTEAAEKYVLSILENAPSAKTEVSTPSEPAQRKPQDFQYEALKEQLDEEKLLRKHPDAETKVQLAKAVSKSTGKDLIKAYEEDILPLVLEGKKAAYATQESKSSQAAVSATEPPKVDSYDQTFEAFKQGRVGLMDVMKAKGLQIKAE